jgi:hypothetical protein
MRRHSGAAHSPVFSGAAHSPMLSGAARLPVFCGAARSPVCVGARLGRAQVPAARGLRLLWRPERHRAEPCFPRGGRRCGRQGQGRCSALCAAPRLLWSSCGARLCLWSLQAGTLFGMPRGTHISAHSGNMGGTMDDSKTKAGGMQSRHAPASRCKGAFRHAHDVRGRVPGCCPAEAQQCLPCPFSQAPAKNMQLHTCSCLYRILMALL